MAGTVVKQKADRIRVQLDGGSVDSFLDNDVILAEQSHLQTHDNLTQVVELKEAVVLHNLRKRFEEQKFYTYIGPILLAVNPYEKLNIYSPTHIQIYKNGARSELPPHVFAIAQEAYRSLRIVSLF